MGRKTGAEHRQPERMSLVNVLRQTDNVGGVRVMVFAEIVFAQTDSGGARHTLQGIVEGIASSHSAGA